MLDTGETRVLLLYGLTLLAGTLVSALAHRTILSTSVLFLGVGFVAGPGVAGVLDVAPTDAAVARLTEIALVTVLFADGMKPDLGRLRRDWSLPARALIAGIPLTMLAVAAIAIVVPGLPAGPALLLGAVLSPTDPVFASAIVGRREIPARVRQLLNVESGLNDGLALPIVVLLIWFVEGASGDPVELAREVVAGAAVGAAVAGGAIALDRLAVLSVAENRRAMHVLAVGLITYALGSVLAANVFVAMFVAGLVIAAAAPAFVAAFEGVAEVASLAMKLGGLLVLGALLSQGLLVAGGAAAYVFALLVLVLARPLAIAISVVGTDLSRAERLVAGWFGPRGFSSLFYGLLVLRTGTEGAGTLFQLVAVTVALSIVLHTLTEVPVARWFGRRPELAARAGARAP